MGCTCVRHTELPNTTPLFADLVYHPDRLGAFYDHPERDFEGLLASAAGMAFPDERRAALVRALRPLNPESAALERLAQAGTVAIVTGQQVGLFSGPAYTVYKALTAVKLARALSEAGLAAVPVFWLATEDHDFAEVNHAWAFDAAHQAQRLSIDSAASGQPVGALPLADLPIASLCRALQGLPFADEAVALVKDSYVPGRTMGEAFGALLRRLTAGYDLIQVDPMQPALRELAAEPLRAALRIAPELVSQVLERNRELQAAGYHAQVHVEEQSSFVFLLENGRRLALRRHQSEYVLNGRRFSTEELMDRAAQLSPNALLRPVVQDWMLPTVAYIGGPAELAYLAQAQVIYRAILGRMPAALSRAGFTIIDERARKLMARYGLSLADFFHGEGVLRERVASRLIPPALAASIGRTQQAVDAAVTGLAAELTAFDVTLAQALDKSRRKIRYQLSKIEAKVARERLARDARATRDAASLYGLIYPQRHLQERLYSILPFIAKHGDRLVPQLYDHVRLECPDHQLLVF